MTRLEKIIEDANSTVHYPAWGDLAAGAPACYVYITVKPEALTKKISQIKCDTCQNIVGMG